MNESQTLTLGGGCFWCLEAVYVKVRGVLDVESGYSNGHVHRPSYEQVCTGSTGVISPLMCNVYLHRLDRAQRSRQTDLRPGRDHAA